MILGGQRMNPLGLMQWAGIMLAAVGGVLMGYVAALSGALVGAHAPIERSMPFDWLLLGGLACLLGGGVLVQFTWKTWRA
jgi:hypothetical protein